MMRTYFGAALAGLCVLGGGAVMVGDGAVGLITIAIGVLGLGWLIAFLERRAAEGITVYTTASLTTEDIEYTEEALPIYVSTRFGFHAVTSSWIARINGVRAMLMEIGEETNVT